MEHSQNRLMKEEVRAMEKDRAELVWRERLLRCQRQLKAKEEEMSRQSQYFEDFKSQLQHKLTVSRDREENLQNRIYTLEKQLLELTVSAATGVATISQVRIAAGTPAQVEGLLFLRGEGEGEEETQEDRRKVGDHQGGEQKEETARDGCSKESLLRKCLLNLKADLNVLLEREESGMMMRRKMMEELQEAQENSHCLSCKVEEMEAEILQLKLTERSLLQEVDELREENDRLQEKQSEVTNQTSDQAAAMPASTGPNPSSLSGGSAVCSGPSNTNLPHPSAGSDGEFVLDNEKVLLTAVSHSRHRGAIKSASNEAVLPLTKSASLYSAQTNSCIPAQKFGFNLAVEMVDDFKFESWCSSGALNLEEAPSEESDALREAYRSLGFGEDLQALQEQCECLEAALQQAQAQLQVLSQENTELKEQLGKQIDGEPAIADEKPSDLIKALNDENRALAARIQELVAHIELDDEVRNRDQSQMKEHISTLEEERARLELEVQEQACLITELTTKTEDDLNSIMELQQKLHQSEKSVQETTGIRELCRSPCPSAFPPPNIDDVIDILVESVINLDEEPQETSPKSSPHLDLNVQALCEQADELTKVIQNLREEEQELADNIRSLREQEREVTLSAQTQAEEKRQLTRQVWGLKEEKDDVSKALSDLKQEKEHLKRAVCGLKEQLRRYTSELDRERERVLCSKSDEIDFIQTLQAEKEQFSQTVLSLKQEKDELMVAIQGLKEERQQFIVGPEGHNSLLKSLSSLKEERKKLEDSISCLREEEKRVKDVIQDLKEQRRKRNVKQEKSQLLTADCQRAELLKELENATLRGHCKEEARSSSAIECEALSAELKKSQEELDSKHNEIKKLHNELQHLMAQRAEADRAAGENVTRVADLSCQMEDIRAENDALATQVKELRLKVSRLQGEKADVLTLQAQIEEKYSVTAAQLKAKSGALDELNSEYMALKKSRGNQDDLTVELVSLRSQYDGIRAKYDSLLRSKSPSDLDLVPLKAKLSCLVSKCQERNSVIVQLIKAMRKHGCLEPLLSQQVDRLLSDAALDDYSKTLIPGSHQNALSSCGGATPGPTSVSRCQEYTSEVTTDHLTPVHQHGATDMPRTHADTPGAAAQANNSDVKSVLMMTRKDKANHSVPCLYSNTSKVQTSPNHTAEQGSSAKKVPSSPNTPGNNHLVKKAESTPDLSRLSSRSSSPLAGQYDDRTRRRLSSPEKIINLHEQLQQTLLSSFQAPRGHGREEQRDKSQSCVSIRDIYSVSSSLRGGSVTMATKETPLAKSTSLFKAVTSRSANMPLGPNILTNQNLRAVKSSCIFGSVTSDKANSTSLNPKVTTLKNLDENDSQLTGASSSDLKTPPRNSSSSDLNCPDFTPKTPAFGTAATSTPTASDGAFKSTTSMLDDVASYSLLRPTSRTRPAQSSPERTSKSTRSSPVAPPEKMKPPRPNPEAPSEVCSVKVIKRVGQCSLMIGWERPPLDELGCSNGTFVYGYRVFVDGSFHKSVLSSACTKCVLENVDTSVPVNISVQTLGANGLCSNRVQVVFESAGSAAH